MAMIPLKLMEENQQAQIHKFCPRACRSAIPNRCKHASRNPPPVETKRRDEKEDCYFGVCVGFSDGFGVGCCEICCSEVERSVLPKRKLI
jgi:hypothetical protein